MPSLKNYLKHLVKRVTIRARYGGDVFSEIKFLFSAIWDSIPKVLNKRIPVSLKNFRKYLLDGVTVKIDGVKYVAPDDESLVIVKPEFEPWMWRYLKPKSGEVFLDVGAHIGKYALKIAKVVESNGLVIAFEPMPDNYRALVKGIKLNGLNNVIALDKPAWNKKCELHLFVAPFSGRGSIKTNFGLGYVKVVAETIDDVVEKLDIKHVDWIKIDVEKSEFEVLQGARSTLKNNNPKLIVEVWKDNEAKVLDFMESLNYNRTLIHRTDDDSASYIYFAKDEKS